MKLYMIRHGQTEWNKEKRLQEMCIRDRGSAYDDEKCR